MSRPAAILDHRVGWIKSTGGVRVRFQFFSAYTVEKLATLLQFDSYNNLLLSYAETADSDNQLRSYGKDNFLINFLNKSAFWQIMFCLHECIRTGDCYIISTTTGRKCFTLRNTAQLDLLTSKQLLRNCLLFPYRSVLLPHGGVRVRF